MNKRTLLIAAGLTTVGALVGFGVKALADGIPSPNPLYYSGTLTEGGKLVNDTRAITINLWPDGTTQGSPLCTTVASSPPAQVVNGRFRIALASACKQVINANNNAYVEVIDGATSLGRTPMGAVPYAVEADHAVSATTATTATTANAAGGSLASTISSIQARTTQTSAVSARQSTSSQNAQGNAETIISFPVVTFDLGAEFNGPNGTFTSKAGGHYLVDCGVELTNTGADANAVTLSIDLNSQSIGQSVLSIAINTSDSIDTVVLANVPPGGVVTCTVDPAAPTAVVVGGPNSWDAFRSHFLATQLF